MKFLKLLRGVAFFDSAGRPFHSLAPRKEKHFCSFAAFFIGNLKSVSALRRLLEEPCEFLVKRLQSYCCGANALRDLKTIILDSSLMSSSMVFQPIPSIRGLLGVSKLLLVMILAARFCSFCKWLVSVEPAQPQNRTTVSKVRLCNADMPV